MSLDVNILGHANESIHSLNRDGQTHLHVATIPSKEYTYTQHNFSNAIYGTQMAINAGSSGVPENVHNGVDNTYWTGSNIIGNKVTFNSTTRPLSGSNSIQVNNATLNDVFQVAKGSDIDLSAYASISLWINVDSDWAEGDSIALYGYNTGTTSIVGNQILLQDYFNEQNFDTWQKISIPLADMGLQSATINSFRVEILARSGKGPIFYIDNWAIQQGGAPVNYTAMPDIGKEFLCTSLNMYLVDALAATVTNGTGIGLSYNKVLGLSQLESGINLVLDQNNVTQFSFNFRNIWDMIRSGGRIEEFLADGTNSALVLRWDFFDSILLENRNEDKFTITVGDDLTGLISFRVRLIGKERTVS